MQYLRRGAYEKLTMAICLLWLYAYDGVTMASYDLYCLLFCDTSLYLHTMHIDGSYTSMAVLTSYVRPTHYGRSATFAAKLPSVW